ncbi:transposase [Clostridium sp.]|uniref:transposase n=1 Tax=Clostridium sp. TaxID=1506 RepID=UPI001A469711|nr:transposase [Clostridium sp.]MBK5241222.1 transposase [Clostridium sp.]
MPRKNMVIYEGAVYHIYQRGNNKEFIFEDDNIKTFILKYLKEYNKKFDYELLAYVIMDNHYHFLIKTNKTDISTIMFFINNLLGKYVNEKLDRTGHAFDSRYKCKLVETDAYLIWLLRYIHRNPVKAHICNDINEYRWSSHYFYNNYVKSHVNIDFILSMLGNSRKSAVEKYLKLVGSIGYENDNDKDYAIIKQELNIKETPFLNSNKENCTLEKLNRTTLDEIIMNLNVDESELLGIRNGNRKPVFTPIKIGIIKGALEQCYSLKEIADFLNAAPSTISKLITRNKII